MRFARVLRQVTMPLLSLLALLSNNGIQVDAAVFGEAGVSNPMMTWTGGPVRCSNNIVRFEWLISQTDSSMNGNAHQPMAESGLPNVIISFNHNILKVAQSAPSQSTTTISANKLMQNVVDDGPNVVQELTFDGITCANFMSVMYSMTATAPATGTTTPQLAFPIKGTVGFSATPVTVTATTTTTTTATAAPATTTNNNNNGGAAANTGNTAAAGVKFGEAGVTNPVMTWTGGPKSCSNTNRVRFEWVISQTDSSMNGNAHQPMAESGLPVVTLSFNHNILSVAQSAPVASTFSANKLTQPTKDDGPNVVQELTFDGGVTCANFMTALVYSMSATAPATGTTAPLLPYPIKGTVGFSATPVTVGQAAGGATNNGGAASATTAPPANNNNNNNNNNAGAGAGAGGIASSTAQNQVKLAGGLTSCFGAATATSIFQFMIQESNNGGQTFSQPMAEVGLPTITVTFNTPVTPQGTVFNVANSKVAGNSWTFTLLDDQPNVGVGLNFPGVACSGGKFAQSVTYQVTAQQNTVQFGVIGTAAGLMAAGTAVAPPAAMATSPPTAPTTAINKNTFGTAKVTNVVQKFTQSGNCWSNAKGAQAELLFNIAQTDSSSPTTPHGPAGETGLPTVTIAFASPVQVSGTFNVANSASTGSAWVFTEMDDQPVVGGAFQFTNAVTCVNNVLMVNGAPMTYTIVAKVGNQIMPTTSNSPGFKALAVENNLDDGSAGTVTMDPATGGSTLPIGLIAGVSAGVVILAIVTLLVIRHRRNKQDASPSVQPKVAWYIGKDTADNKV